MGVTMRASMMLLTVLLTASTLSAQDAERKGPQTDFTLLQKTLRLDDTV